MKRLLLSSAGVAALLIGVTFTSEALAQKGETLSPETRWSVDKVTGRVGEYCTLSRRYTHAALLTVAKNGGLETSIAIDFQRPILKGGKILDIKLDPGAGVERSFQASALANKAIVAKVGNDPSFFEALYRTGFLRVTIENQSYNFNVSDFSDGQDELDNCVATLTPLKPTVSEPPVASVAPAPRPVEPVEELDGVPDVNEVLAQERALQSREAESLRVSDVAAAPIKPIANVTSRVADEINTSSAQSVEALSLQLKRLRDDNAFLKDKLEGSEDSRALKIKISELEARNSALQGELQGVYAERDAGAQRLAEEASKQREELLGLSNSQKAKINELEAVIAQLEKDKIAYSQQLQSMEKQGADNTISQDMQKLQSQYAALVDENLQLKEKINSDVSIEGRVKNLLAENDVLRKALQESEAQIIEMRDQQSSSDFDAQLAALDDRYKKQIKQRESDIEKLIEDNRNLRRQLEHLNAFNSSIESSLFGEDALESVENVVEIDRNASYAQQQEAMVKQDIQKASSHTMAHEQELVATKKRDVDDVIDTLHPADVVELEVIAPERSEENESAVVSHIGSSALYVPRFSIDQVIDTDARLVDGVSNDQRLVYQWKEDNIFASAEQKPLDRIYQFDDLVLEYLQRTEDRCGGDFAIVPDRSEEFGPVRFDRYDVACVGSGVNSSAALLFFNKEGTFNILAHEAPSEKLLEAISLREDVIRKVTGS